MTGFRAPMPTFAGGEIAPSVASRFDTAKYATCLERGRNVLGLPGGGQYNRPGTEFGAAVRDHTKLARLLPFVFSTDQGYALEFSHLTMRVFSGGELVTRPRLIITAITKAASAVVTVPNHGYSVGWDVYFQGVLGMTEINGLTGRITAIAGNDITVNINSTGFSTFTADSGGIAGNALGGVGGYAPVDPNAPPPDIPYTPTVPPTGGGTGTGVLP